MKKIILFISILLCSNTIEAQNYLDSLWNIWQDKTQHDTVRLEAIDEFNWNGYIDSQPDSAIYFAQLQYDFAKAKGHKNYMQKALNSQGLSYLWQSEYPKAIDHISRAVEISREINNKRGIAGGLTNLGLCYASIDNYSRALDLFIEGLKIHEEIKNKDGISTCLGHIGNLYLTLKNYEMALKYLQKSLKLTEELNDITGVAHAYNSIAYIYQKKGEQQKALEYFELSLKLMVKEKNKVGVAIILGNIGQCYVELGDYIKADSYFKQALMINKELNSSEREASNLINMGLLYNRQKNWNLAITSCDKALKISEKIELISLQKSACECLYKAHKSLNNKEKALFFHEKMLSIQEVLDKDEASKKLQQMEFANQILKDSLANIEKNKIIEAAHQKELNKKNRTRNILLGGGVIVILLAIGLFGRLKMVRKSKASLQVEKDRSENLLLNILPADIAEELKTYGKAEARDFQNVSILFTDFVGFTETSEKLNAQELVAEINTCFKAFDAISEKYGIEKIKTIGDAYMAAGGLPIPKADSVKNTVLAALEMQSFMMTHKKENDALGKPAFEMRVGIHTGSIVAGIVGVKKFQYDVWGDTVNTASRIESNGAAGKVNISSSTYELIKDQFKFTPRGKIEVKGKGEMEMYFVKNLN